MSPDRRRVLITGAGGQLGAALAAAFAGDDVDALTRAQWDVRFPPPLLLEPPDLVLHSAAWTNVDGAEDDPQGAAEVNVGGTAHAAELGVPLVAYSTDYVFDGRKGAPYVESDSPSPQSAYGMTKLHGEAAAGERAWVIRSSWLFGATGHNFVRTMLRLGAERDEVAVVADQRGCPTYVGHLAAATRELVDAESPSASGTSPPTATAPGPISPRRSSTRPVSTAGCGGSRRQSSAPAPRARRSRSCAARRTHPSSPTGARASPSASPRSLTQGHLERCRWRAIGS